MPLHTHTARQLGEGKKERYGQKETSRGRPSKRKRHTFAFAFAFALYCLSLFSRDHVRKITNRSYSAARKDPDTPHTAFCTQTMLKCRLPQESTMDRGLSLVSYDLMHLDSRREHRTTRVYTWAFMNLPEPSRTSVQMHGRLNKGRPDFFPLFHFDPFFP